MSKASLKEASTRKIIDSMLNHLGWSTDERRADCNVFSERAKTSEQNALPKGRQPDYILYESGTDKPIAVIEAKRPGGGLEGAIRQAARHYAAPLEIDIVFATDGTLFQSFDRRSEGPLLLDGEPVTDLLAPKLMIKFAGEGPALVTPSGVNRTKGELMNIFKHANDLLRKDGLREGIERFNEFSNLMFLKLISEIEIDRENRGEPRRLEQRYCWEAFSTRAAPDMLDYLNDTVLSRFAGAYNNSSDVFQARLGITRPETLKAVVDGLSELSLLDIDSDIKGDAFEYFLKHSVTVGNDLGEYFTPRHIVKLMVDLIDPAYMEQVYDPCCGTGGFLIEAFRHISRKVKWTDQTRHVLENDTIFGREITGTARIAKMNMILAGDGHTHIHQRDCLEDPVSGKFDVVLTNFAFSQKTDHAGLYGLDTEDANPVFLKHAIDACKDGGRIAVVVPEGLLFTETQQYENMRRYVLDNCEVVAVIALNAYVFQPYTGQPTAILILNKGKAGTGPVWFFDVADDGFEKTSRNKGRRPDPEGNNDLVRLRSLWSEKPETDQSFSVDVKRIRENAFKLSMSAYRRGRNEEAMEWAPLGGEGGVCDIVLGATPGTENEAYWAAAGEGHVWATIADMKHRYVTSTQRTITDAGVAKSSVKRVPKGTVLLSFKLSIGKTATAGCDLYTNEAIAALVPRDDRILPEYLYHLLPAIDLRNYMQPTSKGKTLNKRILEKVRIPVPARRLQAAFVERMNALETRAIELREKASELDRETLEVGRAFVMSGQLDDAEKTCPPLW